MEPAWWFFVLVAGASLVEAVAGFGSTVLTITLAANAYDIPQLVAVLVPPNVVFSAVLVARHRHRVAWGVLFKNILPVMGAGVVGGRWVAQSAGSAWLKLGYGALVMALAARGLWRLRREAQGAAVQPHPPAWQGWFWLAGAGLAQGIYASGGPLVVVFMGTRIHDKTVFRTTLSALWLVVNIYLSFDLYRQGSLTGQSLLVSGLVLVPMLVGLGLGEVVHKRIHEGVFRRAVFGVLLLAGAALAAGVLRQGLG